MLTEIEFDLSKFVMKDELCPNFWKNEKLNSEIRKKLLEIAEDFVKIRQSKEKLKILPLLVVWQDTIITMVLILISTF